MTWVKICGTTSLEDALAAVEAGADALGFVFATSPRRVTAEQVRAIIDELPATVEKVGVFVNESADRIREIVKGTGLTSVQLHGEESDRLLAEVNAMQTADGRQTEALSRYALARALRSRVESGIQLA